ncbi:hypothetical protein BH23ACT2_BH23ACT2_15780 [soil metagenome]
MTVTTMVVLGIAFTLFGARLLLGPTLADRIASLDGMIWCGVAALVVVAVETGEGPYLPVAVVLTLVAFIGTTIVARFIEGSGR